MSKKYIKAFVLNKIQRYQTQHTYFDVFSTFPILNKWLNFVVVKTSIAIPAGQTLFPTHGSLGKVA